MKDFTKEQKDNKKMKALELLHEQATSGQLTFKEYQEHLVAISELEALQARIKQFATIGTCGECMFWKDDRKCPMENYENVAEENFCYNFYPKGGNK